MSIREFHVNSLGELLDRVTPATPDSTTGRRRDTGIYHGDVDACAPLLTSLDQLGGVSPPHTKAALEEPILRNFIRYSRPYWPHPPANDWELLVGAQHHGVPTRLLDWSYSPLIAAFFATRVGTRHALHGPPFEESRSCVIWRLDWQAMHNTFHLPPVALRIEELSTVFGAEHATTPWDVFKGVYSASAFACLIEPPSLDARIMAQAAAFTICSSTTESFDHFLVRHGLESALTKYIIPASGLSTFRDQLDLAGMDERRLFPDLDGVAAALRRYYM